MSKQPELTKDQLQIILVLIITTRELLLKKANRGKISNTQYTDLLMKLIPIQKEIAQCLDEADLKKVYEGLILPKEIIDEPGN